MRALLLPLVACTLVGVPVAACAQDQREAGAQTQSTDSAGASYRRAAATLQARIDANSGDAAARRDLLAALVSLGRYDDAERVAAAGGQGFTRWLADIQLLRGKRAGAEASYRRALTTADSVAARLGIALIHYDRGERDNAIRELEWFIGFYNNAAKLTADELTAVGRAVTVLGVTDPQLFHDAVKAYEGAVQADATNIDARIAEAALFLDKYDSENAGSILRETFAIEPENPRALVQLARAVRFDGDPSAIRHVERALAVNPNLVEAHVLRAELLVAAEDYKGATESVDRALAIDTTSIPALAVHAAIAYLQGERAVYDQARERVRILNPLDTRLLTKVAELAGQERRFTESVTLAQQAIAIDSAAWDAHTIAGLGVFRLGRFEEAAAILNTSFKGDPYNIWVKNTLDLIDKYPGYATRRNGRFELLLKNEEADLLELYMRPLAEQAYDTFATRYRWRPPSNIRVEVYPRHGDFSVRTVGLSGLGALGVSFGEILAMDSPAARAIGEFHWASTLWHEIAHTFTLGASKARVPRWLTEGISGWEESHSRKWGDPLTPSFLQAYAAGRLPALSKITPAFIRPAYPEQVVHAYQMAELVVEHIVETRGNDAVRRMLVEFGDGKTQDDVFRSVLRVTPAQYDGEFDAWMKKRFGTAFAALEGGPQGAYGVALARGRELLEQGSHAAAEKELEKARVLLPEYTGPGSPYPLLAQSAIGRGDDATAVKWLDQLTQRYAQDYEAWILLGTLREKLGDRRGASVALEQAMYVHPYDPALHDRLAILYLATARPRDAVRERRAVVALKPVDKAAAFYNLAVALEAAGDRAAAKTEVLNALEIAPGYGAAQELLLRLQGSR